MEYLRVVDKWAEEFDIKNKIPNTECLIVLLANLSLIDFIRSDVDSNFLNYVSRKFAPELSSKYFEITVEIVEKQVLSLNYILAQGRSTPSPNVRSLPKSEIDYELLKDLEFDISRLGIE